MNKDQHTSEGKEVDWTGFLPGIAIDCVMVGYNEKQLKVLILEYKETGFFALPGGFIRRNENLDVAAQRVLQKRTGLEGIQLNQFHTFGSLNRYAPEPMRKIMKKNGLQPAEDHFLLQRFVSTAYYALVNFEQAEPIADFLSDSCRWYDINQLPKLLWDHRDIIQKALESLRKNIDDAAVGLTLLDEEYTMRELRTLYETILDKEINRSSFHRKMVNSGRLERVGKKSTGKAHRSPYLYKFVSN
ncbi:NUDIX hydrolase [Fodinibius salsisoli]|uniref:NUDIX hydrolase n=1 Tax=Fodinibius salsisoli TaxID=2820877 RepID=A0ABT3PP23_9BACT|nr:NUDIX domain-containing protein [Fodinibius salsisoli]MCW9707609.1 NUDIX hydrolase [Fodinibius salsisoli]